MPFASRFVGCVRSRHGDDQHNHPGDNSKDDKTLQLVHCATTASSTAVDMNGPSTNGAPAECDTKITAGVLLFVRKPRPTQ